MPNAVRAMSFMMHHHSTAEIVVFLVFSLFSLPVCLFMDGWMGSCFEYAHTHESRMTATFPLFIGCEV
jgi:hypothetical protein